LGKTVYQNTLDVFSTQQLSENKIIVVDVGHGGADPGKVNGNYIEKDINLAIAIKVKKLLARSGYKVVMTRTEDEIKWEGKQGWSKDDDMKLRRNIARKSKGNLLISIHANSYPDSACKGAQTFYYSQDKSGKQLAELLQSELKLISPFENNREAKSIDNLYILKENGMPSVIVECGFLSNPEEAGLLIDGKYQNKIAGAIKKGVDAYFAAMQRSIP